MKKIFVCLSAIVTLASCGGGGDKKVLVISKGTATINQEAKTVTVTSGTSSEEQTVDFKTADKVTLAVESQAGKTNVDLPTNGYYVLNAKADTIVGSYQNYGAPKTEATVITQDAIKARLDSLQQLIKGQNVSAANRNFIIYPNTAVKISDNLDAFVVGPFHQMTSVAKTGDKEPEVYRFYMVSEIRESIAKLEALTKGKEEVPAPAKKK